MEKSYCELLGVEPDWLANFVCDLEWDGAIASDYIRPIAEKLVEEIARDIWETADHKDWNADDLRLAFGRVLCQHLGVEV